ncbi:unnamed protein product [Staurois parvus]|uniref:Uncharacterized protein n=1 Tax=Staurois parvus TaxID=386267 RepID=A0ABN9BRY3_9NEOB|nr:unnamed protein product [Staurois parvus]
MEGTQSGQFMALRNMRLVGTLTVSGLSLTQMDFGWGSDLSTAPTQLSRDNIRLTWTQQDFGWGSDLSTVPHS